MRSGLLLSLVILSGCSLVLDPGSLQGGDTDSGRADATVAPDATLDGGHDAGVDAALDDGGDGGDAGCVAPRMMCGTSCVDTTSADAHCGACDNACDPGTYCSDSACRPSVERFIQIGTAGFNGINSLVTDAAGAVYVAGSFTGSVDFGTGTARTAVGLDAFVASFAADGTFRWVETLGGAGDDVAKSLDFDPTVGVVVTGTFVDAATVDSLPLSSAGGADMFVLALDPASGALRWRRSIGGVGDDEARRLTVAPGRVYVAGNIQDGFSFASSVLTGAGMTDGVLFALSADASTSTPLWAVAVEGAGGNVFDGVAATPGRVCAAGHFTGTADFEGASLTSAGGLDGLVACVTTDGVRDWHVTFANAGDDLVSDIAFGTDFLAITGTFEDSLSFGPSDLMSGGHWDIYVATTSLMGTPRWARSISSVGMFDFPTKVDVDDADEISVATILNGAGTVGGVPLAHVAGSDWAATTWRADGTLAWARSWGGTGDERPRAVVRSATGDVWMAGEFQGDVDFSGSFSANADFDAALVRLAR